jgi:sec1 family domain-containing protein 1
MAAPALPSYQRPVLIILDRNVDLSVMMHHPWTYQALVHDILNVVLNRVVVDVQEEGEARAHNKSYDLDASLDSFWNTNAASPFPNVAGISAASLVALSNELLINICHVGPLW